MPYLFLESSLEARIWKPPNQNLMIMLSPNAISSLNPPSGAFSGFVVFTIIVAGISVGIDQEVRIDLEV